MPTVNLTKGTISKMDEIELLHAPKAGGGISVTVSPHPTARELKPTVKVAFAGPVQPKPPTPRLQSPSEGIRRQRKEEDEKLLKNALSKPPTAPAAAAAAPSPKPVSAQHKVIKQASPAVFKPKQKPVVTQEEASAAAAAKPVQLFTKPVDLDGLVHDLSSREKRERARRERKHRIMTSGAIFAGVKFNAAAQDGGLLVVDDVIDGAVPAPTTAGSSASSSSSGSVGFGL